MKRFLLSILIAGSIFLFNIPAYAIYQGERAESGKPEFVPGQILVKFRADTSQAVIREINEKQKARLKKMIRGLDVHVLTFSTDIPVEEMVRRYNADVSVEYAEPDYIATATEILNDRLFNEQWGLNNKGDKDIDALQGWYKNIDTNTGSFDVKIAIVDTGIYAGHEDITGKVAQGCNTIGVNASYPNNPCTSTDTSDDNGHGTHVAGIAAAVTNNSKGIAGVCWGCTLMPVKVLNADGSGTYSDVSDGIMWAANNGAKVINLSLGGPFPSDTLQNAVNYAWNKGVVLACAAGNSGGGGKLYPAYYENCIAVAATDNNDKKAYFSTFGKWVDVAAPGVSIISTVPVSKDTDGTLDGYVSWSGTSMATPHVSGLAGLLFSKYLTYTNTKQDVRERIETWCDKITGTGRYWAKGRINVCKSLDGTSNTDYCDQQVVQENSANGVMVGTK